MTTTQTLITGANYEVVSQAHISADDFELESIMYHCKDTMTAIDITDFLYDFLDTGAINELEQNIINQND